MKDLFAFLQRLRGVVESKVLSVADKKWVLSAFFRGKVLRQRAYLPAEDGTTGFLFFRLPETTPIKRLGALLGLWNFRFLGAAEIYPTAPRSQPVTRWPNTWLN